MWWSFPGESYIFAFSLVIFDGSEGFIVQGGKKDKDQVPLPGQKLRAFIPLEMNKISVIQRPRMA